MYWFILCIYLEITGFFMVKISVSNNKGFEWVHNDTIYFKGYFYDLKDNLLQGTEALEYFSQINSVQDFEKRVRNINGSFVVIMKLANTVLAAVDRIRSIPIFIYRAHGIVHISDDIYQLCSLYSLIKYDNLGIEQMRLSGYTIGNRTGIESIKQLCAGEYCIIESSDAIIKKYYVHLHGNYVDINEQEIKEHLNTISDNVFSRLVKSVNGRQIIVPLSGGYDSRYIVCWLKKIGYENVCCFTYGNKNNIEAQVSKKVAETLGYEWHCVEYSYDTWKDVFTPKWEEFFKYAGQLSQVPHHQDIYAVKYLVDNGIIEKNAVVVPGYCGDGLGGSFLYKEDQVQSCTFEDLLNKILERQFSYSYNWKSDLKKSIIDSLYSSRMDSLDDYNNIHEEWATINKWSKFVVNAVRGYEYQGLTWRLPFWDNELVEFWYKIPNEIRQRKLYDEFLLEGIFEQYGVSMRKPQERGSIANAIVKTCKKTLMSVLGYRVLKLLRKKVYDLKNEDAFYFMCIPELLEKDNLINAQDYNGEKTNSLVALYYLLRVEKIYNTELFNYLD